MLTRLHFIYLPVSVVTAMLLIAFLFPAAASGNDSNPPTTFAEALKGGEATVKLRYRFEIVDDDPPSA